MALHCIMVAKVDEYGMQSIPPRAISSGLSVSYRLGAVPEQVHPRGLSYRASDASTASHDEEQTAATFLV